jgi:hypothetical protein
MNLDSEKDHTEDYEFLGRAICREMQTLMAVGWRSPFVISVTGADDELLFEARYEGSGSGPGHFASTAGDDETLLREVTFPVEVSITDAGGQVTLVTLQQRGPIQ